MDIYDVGAIAILSGYGLGYLHSNLVRGSIKRSAEEWFQEAIGQAATFGLLLMTENELDGDLNCFATIDGCKMAVTVAKVEKEVLENNEVVE